MSASGPSGPLVTLKCHLHVKNPEIFLARSDFIDKL